MKVGHLFQRLYAQLRAYAAIAYISSLSRTAFFGALMMNGLLVGLYIWTIKQLYAATFAAAQTQQIGGLTLVEAVWLLMFVQSFERATWPNPITMIDEEIKSGVILYSLQRPYSYLLYQLSSFWGRIAATVIGNLCCGSIVALLLIGPCTLTLQGFAGGLFALVLGYTLDFCIFFIFGITGFWVEDVKPFTWLYSKAKLVLGGVIIPIAFFPVFIQNIVLLLPFSNLYYTASRLIVQFDLWLFLRCITVQACWIGILGGCAYALFAKGVKHVTVSGG
jgi:ABC-2 type transport system permease protein